MTVLPNPIITRLVTTRVKESWFEPAADTTAPIKIAIGHAIEPLAISKLIREVDSSMGTVLYCIVIQVPSKSQGVKNVDKDLTIQRHNDQVPIHR
jgi:hypothetical protein